MMVLLLQVMVKLLRSLLSQCSQMSAVVLLKFLITLYSQLSDINFTESEVFALLPSLKHNKTSGPDNLHSQVLKIVLKIWLNLFFYC